MSNKGIDYSWARPNPVDIKSEGFDFAMRYLSHDDGKNISRDEANALLGAGVDVGLVWESYARRPLEGRKAGLADGNDAQSQAKAVGFPSGSTIYAAVDFDTSEAQQAPIDEYLKGFTEGLGDYETGVYGSYYICKRCDENKTATKFWQTLAWSGGQIYEKCHIYQNGATAFGSGADQNEGRKSDLGNWKADGSQPSPSPAPAPQPEIPQPQEVQYTVVAGDTLGAIARRFGTTYQVLAKINGIADANQIGVGQVISLPNGTNAAPIPNGIVYTVVSGDTLSGIGKRFGVDYHIIAENNGIKNPNSINVGQVLRIAGGGAPTAPPQSAYYTVQSGDYLGKIAAAYHTSVSTLTALNGLADPDKIYAGQVLRVS